MEKERISYWDGNGKYQDVQTVLWDKWIPDSGASIYIDGEIVRGIGRLWHELGNNGNCNARDGREITEMYDEFLWKMEEFLGIGNKLVQVVRNCITQNRSFEKCLPAYNKLTNACLEKLIVEYKIDLHEYKLEAIQVKINDALGTANFYRKQVFNQQTEVIKIEKMGGTAEEINKVVDRVGHSLEVVNKYEAKARELRKKYIELATNPEPIKFEPKYIKLETT